MDSKKKNSLYIVFGIVAIVYMVSFCVIPFKKRAASWVAFVFGIIAIVGACAIVSYALSKGSELKSKVYGFPIISLGYSFFVAQLALVIIVSVAAAFVPTPVWIPLVISVLLIGLVSIGVIATENARDIIEAQDQNIINTTKQTTLFRLDVDSLLDGCIDADVRKKLEKLAEEFKYSDPVSSDELEGIEQEISNELDDLRVVLSVNEDESKQRIDRIMNLLADRNRRCKAMKQH